MAARSTKVALVSRSLAVRRDSVVGTRRIYDSVRAIFVASPIPFIVGHKERFRQLLTWSLTGLHCEGRGLLKKARRKGLRECIHPTCERDQRPAKIMLSRPLGLSDSSAGGVSADWESSGGI